MGNLFCTEYTVHRRFDLKGSVLGRMTDKPETEIDETTILKDLDLNFVFRLQKSWFQDFCRQIDRDCEFLEQERIMDYSLLVGLHFRNVSANGDLISSGSRTPTGCSSFLAFHYKTFCLFYFGFQRLILLIITLHALLFPLFLAGEETEGAPRLSRADMDQLLLDPSR